MDLIILKSFLSLLTMTIKFVKTTTDKKLYANNLILQLNAKSKYEALEASAE